MQGELAGPSFCCFTVVLWLESGLVSNGCMKLQAEHTASHSRQHTLEGRQASWLGHCTQAWFSLVRDLQCSSGAEELPLALLFVPHTLQR